MRTQSGTFSDVAREGTRAGRKAHNVHSGHCGRLGRNAREIPGRMPTMRTTEHVSPSSVESDTLAQKVRIGHRVAARRNSGASTLKFWREMTDTSDMDRNGRKGHEMEISVAIGRNVGNEPMSDIDWLDFRS